MELKKNKLFLFPFFHAEDIARMEAGRPWTFDRITKRLEQVIARCYLYLLYTYICFRLDIC